MVSVLNPGRSLRNTIHYNEHKVRQGKAALIHSVGFGKDTHQLSITDKLGHLQKLAARNPETKVNSIHISLNFHPSEKLSPDTLQQIAAAYIKKIGFEGQPYLVYEHHDAGHPHLHIVTTNIRPSGKRIKLHNIGRNESEQARKAIEKEFHLVPADHRGQRAVFALKPIDAQKVQYGRSDTKRAITTVLDHVLPTYKYSSLAELNAVLGSYNVVADQGGKDSRIYKTGGLVYRVLDEQGKRVGVPVKASDFYNKPTLKELTPRFEANDKVKQPHKQRIKNAVDLAFARKTDLALPGLIDALRKEHIQLVLRKNQDGIIYGLTYVDHKTKTVFNGSALGKSYSANQVVQRTGYTPSLSGHNGLRPDGAPHPSNDGPLPSLPPSSHHIHLLPTPPGPSPVLPPAADPSVLQDIVSELTDSQPTTGPAAELRREWKRKKKRRPRI